MCSITDQYYKEKKREHDRETYFQEIDLPENQNKIFSK